MRVVLAVVWLMVLCLPVSAAETVQRFNTNGDGQADQIIHYDGEGRIARVLQNLDADGKPHAWMEYKAGVLASSAFDTSNNGQADQWHHYQADGHVTRIEYDQNGDGRPDQWEHFKPGSDEPHKVESDTDDGNVDSVWETSDQ